MKILAHRGLWSSEEEKNSIECLRKAIEQGYGIETDIRDFKGKLVISHDVASENCPLLEDLFRIYQSIGSDVCLALNIKADGLQERLKGLLDAYQIQNYFLFDMSIPEFVVNKKYGLTCFTRNSDIERECVLYDYADGVWMDSFYDVAWLRTEMIDKHLKNGKRIGIISSEIHGYEKNEMWRMLKSASLDDSVMLCTDCPKEAKEYFVV